MPTYTYTGTLADIGLGALVGRSPRMRVRPEREAFGPDGLISAVPRDVTLDPATGAFSVQLIATSDLKPEVRYTIEVDRFETSFDGSRFNGIDTWTFVAPIGGGPVGELLGLQLGNDLVWADEDVIDLSKRTGFQLDTVTGDLYQWKA